jgi:excinuclease ABC subunit A
LDRFIRIRGARTHNLKNISLDIPHGRLTVVTGVSGSGKSSLVFDTVYAEGQRRYVQSLSTYARLFLERLERPDVDTISDIPPALALKQKNTIKNARSTVGTVTEINDYLRLLFASVGQTICPRCRSVVTRDSVASAAQRVLETPGAYIFLAPFAVGSRSPRELSAFLAATGHHRIYRDGLIVEASTWLESLADFEALDTIAIVLDRVTVSDGALGRVREALERAFHLGGGRAEAVRLDAQGKPAATLKFDRRCNCDGCGAEFPEPSPALFSSNSPLGACPHCEGFGRISELDLDKILPDPNLSLRQGLVAPFRTPAYREMQSWMLRCAKRSHIRTTAPLSEMSEVERAWLLDGESAADKDWDARWPGVRGFFRWLERKRYKTHVRILLARYRRFTPCPSCEGSKLKTEALNVRVGDKTIAEVGRLPIRELPRWLDELASQEALAARATVLLRELKNRVNYLIQVGLGYLTLERQARTLAGGEAQRIHLAGALGSLLTGTLYALDEPTVGLHAADSRALLEVLRRLRDLGNSVLVVEHDPAMIEGADYVVQLGPVGGHEGGHLVAAGAPTTPGSSNGNGASAGRALLMRALAHQQPPRDRGQAIRIIGARAHNLRDIDVEIPLRRLTCLSGVSGSGKSTLMETVLYNNYLRRLGEPVSEVGECRRVEGLELVGAMVHMGQELPARSLRSNPATYLKVYDEIRGLFAATDDARRGRIKSRDFSFNVAGGRCERCQGTGTVTLEMHFMADLEVTCDLCDGRRFQSQVLAVRFHGYTINDVLSLTVEEAQRFFQKYPGVTRRLEPLAAAGLGYLQLGQPTSTLSGGEMQRLKLARFLLADLEPPPAGARDRRLTRVFLLDEPTTGLASSDIKGLVRMLRRLINEGNTLVVIEHNLEFIAQADHVIDLGPGGGDDGGAVVAVGDPLQIAANKRSLTGRELSRLLGLGRSSAMAGRKPSLKAVAR